MATRADEAENVTNVEVKAAVSDLEAHVVSTSHAAAQQRDVAVPIQAGVHMHHAFGLAGAAAAMYVIRSVARLCCSVVEGQFQKLLQFGQRLLCNIVVAEGGEEGRGASHKKQLDEEFRPFPRLFVTFLNAFLYQINAKIVKFGRNSAATATPPLPEAQR